MLVYALVASHLTPLPRRAGARFQSASRAAGWSDGWRYAGALPLSRPLNPRQIPGGPEMTNPRCREYRQSVPQDKVAHCLTNISHSLRSWINGRLTSARLTATAQRGATIAADGTGTAMLRPDRDRPPHIPPPNAVRFRFKSNRHALTLIHIFEYTKI